MRQVTPVPAVSRREFLHGVVVGSAASMLSGHAWAGTAVASVRPSVAGDPGILRLRIADFPPLQGSFGAVRLGFSALGQVSPMHPFIVSRDEEDFFAVTAECTHAGCLIPAFGNAKNSTCPCHGSRFGHDGRVIRGPATSALPRYEVSTEESGVVQIFLPEISSYHVTVRHVLAPGTSRTALGFRSLTNVDYEVLGRASALAEWSPQPFALTENGSADRTTIKGTGGDQTVYLENTGVAGFFTVSAKVRTV